MSLIKKVSYKKKCTFSRGHDWRLIILFSSGVSVNSGVDEVLDPGFISRRRGDVQRRVHYDLHVAPGAFKTAASGKTLPHVPLHYRRWGCVWNENNGNVYSIRLCVDQE